MEFISLLTDQHAESLRGGAGDNVPPGFFDPATGTFNHGRYTATEHSGMVDYAFADGSGYARVLPNGKIIQWGQPIFP